MAQTGLQVSSCSAAPNHRRRRGAGLNEHRADQTRATAQIARTRYRNELRSSISALAPQLFASKNMWLGYQCLSAWASRRGTTRPRRNG